MMEENNKNEEVNNKVEKEDELIKIRKDKLSAFFKTKHFFTIIALIILIWLGVWIRTLNTDGLRDITTGSWTLGPDLDPFLFLRWTEYIVEHGRIMDIDTMRNVPLGYPTSGEQILLPYLMAWFHKIAVFFGSTSVIQSAVYFPVFMFALTIIAMFLLTRRIFLNDVGEKRATYIAIIASFFLIVLPSLLPRTIAGIPEKESAAFFFILISFYLFINAWESKKNSNMIIWSILAGVSTAMLGLIWGGVGFVFYTISLVFLVAFLLGKVDISKVYIMLAWIITTFLITVPSSTRYEFPSVLFITPILIIIITLAAYFINFVINRGVLKKYLESPYLNRIPVPIVSLIIVIVGSILVSLIWPGPQLIIGQINEVTSNLITPIQSRFGVTVAENRQPFFNEWADSFGPNIRSNIPVFFWLFFIGSVYLCYRTFKDFSRKERILLTASYLFFIMSMIFSRYRPESIFNGTNAASKIFYAAGFIIFIGAFGYHYYYLYKKGEESKLKNLNLSIIILFIFFFLGIIAARGAVRTIMVLVPSAAIICSYLIVVFTSNSLKVKDELFKISAWIIAAIIILAALYSGYNFYEISKGQAQVYKPSIYTQQWQLAMKWVRDNTPKDSVFGHWWDYGYWLQTLGERATVLDGGNAIVYWNHLMGRHALTGTSNEAALEFLYAHNTTHFLIDSTDIGKYSAFSSIGSDVNYDRASWIQVFLRNPQEVQETKNGTIYLYSGGSPLDEDILYKNNGTSTFLPGGKAGIAGFLVEKDKNKELVKQPIAIFGYQNKRYDLPLRYAYDNGRFIDFGSGIEAGIFIFPRFTQDSQGPQLDRHGALLYLSNRTVKSQLARLYLYEENTSYFKIVHSEDDFLVSQLKQNNIEVPGGIVYYDGIRGPIRIWEINYSSNVTFNKDYLNTDYPDVRLTISR